MSDRSGPAAHSRALTGLLAGSAVLILADAALAYFAAAAGSALARFGPLALAVAAAALLGAAIVLAGRIDRKVRDQRLTAETQRKENDRNQQAILRLLDELSSLADGDLTVQATVTEEITGAIADSINYAVDALRGLVTTI
ncbi:twitching motility protein PilJ, partial [mine drainage metagenome]